MSTEPKPSLSQNFLARLYDELKTAAGEELSLENFRAAVRRARAHAGGKAKAEKSKAMAESLTDTIEKVQSALWNAFRNRMGESEFSYAKEVFSNYVITCSNIDGKDYKISYSIVNDEINFGDPEEVETVYVPVGTDIVGMHEVADLCADGRGLKLFNEFRFADPPEWFNFLPKPGKYNSPVYGEIVITEERNQNFIDNFDNKVYQEKLPIDCEHDISASGAVGWITGMRLNTDGSVDAKAEWNDRGKELIENDRFKYFSPSWFSVWTDPVDADKQITDVAIGGALTTRPFFKEKALRPLVANEKGLSILDGDLKNLNSESAVVVMNFTALTPVENSKEIANMADKDTPSAEEIGLVQKFRELFNPKPENKDTVSAEAFSEVQGKLNAAETELASTKTALAAAEAKATNADERITSLEKSARGKRFSEMAKDFMGEAPKHVEMMEFLATSDEKGEEGERFKDYVAQQKAIAEQGKNAKLFAEIGHSNPVEGGAVAAANAEVKKFREADPTLSEAQAFDKWWENASPAERQDYREEQRVSNN